MPLVGASTASVHFLEPSSFGSFTGAVRRYLGGVKNTIILATVSRDVEMARNLSLDHALCVGQPNLPVQIHGENPSSLCAIRKASRWPTFPPPFSALRAYKKLAHLREVLERQRVQITHAVPTDCHYVLFHFLADFGPVAVADTANPHFV